MTELPDDVYRNLIKAKIAANAWDGTKEGAYEVWKTAFGDDSKIAIIDNLDMSIDMIISGIEPDAAFIAIIEQGLLPLRPAGVKIKYHVMGGKPLFCWGLEESEFTGGWNIGYWA